MELIYLPMADVYLSFPLLLAIGLVGGIVSTMLGIGGGIIITPSLMSIGIPSSVAISTQLSNAVGTNFSGFLTYQQERDVDISLAWYLFMGGIAGALVENIALLKALSKSGGFAVLKIIVFFVLVICSIFTLVQSQIPKKKRVEKGAIMRRWMIYFPWHKIFLRSRVEMSILVPIGVGFFTGMVTTSLGGGNSLLIAPILTYLLARSSPVVSGTSLLAGFGINIVVTFASSMGHSLIDFVLLPILAVSSVIGSVIGGRLAYRFKSKILGIIGAFVLMAIAYKMYLELKAVNWQTVSNGQSYVDKFPNIIKKITAMPDQQWMLPIAQFAYDSPVEYTIIMLVSVTIFATVVQFLINRIEWYK
jgi:uncharacterized membrane protein YfcA